MRFVRLMLAGLLMLLPFPALADVTAYYSITERDSLTIEADDGGNLRAGVADKFAIIRRDGVDYVIIWLPNGDAKVADANAVVEMVASQMKGQTPPEGAAKMEFALKQGGQESVLGFSGTVWTLGPIAVPGKPEEKPIEVLISADPRLAPVGGFFHRFFGLMNPMLGLVFGGNTNLGDLALELFAKGTPLKFGKALTLDKVDHAEIAAERFELPGPVIQPMEFLSAVMPSESGAGLPALP